MGLALLALGGAATVPARPNFLVIVADDLDTAAFELAMPRTRALVADRGMRFTRALVSTPLCCPSRASLLRGQYAHNHGVLSNLPAAGGYERFVPLEHATLATHLQGAGYHTAMIGKHLNGYGDETAGPPDLTVPPGWSRWAAILGPPGYFSWTLNVDGRRSEPGSPGAEPYLTDRLAQIVRRAIRTAPAPWFILFMPYAPHRPADPAPRHVGAFATASLPRQPSFNEPDVSDKPAHVRALSPLSEHGIAHLQALHRRRLESLLALDEAIAGAVAGLRARGQLRDTYIVVTSDNGVHLGQHRLRHGKLTPYTEDVIVPLVVRGPGVPAGTVSDALVLNVDLAPTLSRLAGLAPPARSDGRSLARLLRGRVASPWRRVALVEQPSDQELVPRWAGLRSDRYAYTEYPGTGERELYDLQADPHELTNLAATASPCLLEALRTRLAALAACARRTCRAIDAEPLPTCP